MLFHSIEFIFFFCFIFVFYYFLNKKHKLVFLLSASYFFYGAWNYKFLLLILSSTLIDYFCGRIIYQSNQSTRKRFLLISVILNLGLLSFFKYSYFITDNINLLFGFFDYKINTSSWNIILPIGISFYTFQSMSYTIDIYKNKIPPEKSFIKFALYISFFPQLIAGPIERAKHFIPLMYEEKKYTFGNIKDGCWLFFWGLFQKIVIADNMAIVSDWVFDQQNINHDGWLVLASVYAFSFQILADFAGYTDMARGIAKMLNYDLCLNFKAPYFSTNPSEFWTRWHISLSSWLKDYLYIPLGGNKCSNFKKMRNLLFTMLLGGLWHGASWNFVLWGLYNGFILIIFHSCKEKIIFSGFKTLKILGFYHIICFGWIIFRSQSLYQVKQILYSIFFNFNISNYSSFSIPFYLLVIIYTFIQYKQYRENNFENFFLKNALSRSTLYLIFFYIFIFFGIFNRQEFIYFQF